MTADPHGHASPGADTRALRIVLLITATFLAVEVAGGLISGSLALLADAGHMLTDVASLALSLIAFRLSARPRSPDKTFGWRRAEIFAALLNGLALWGIAGVIIYEAVLRIRTPHPVNDTLMTVVAAAGLLANLAGGFVLFRSRGRNLNMRGAFLHVLADALGSVGVLAAALLIAVTGNFVWDPIVSLAISALIVLSSVRLIRESFNIFMEAVPAHIDAAAIEKALAAVPGVVSVHDLHIWTITSGFVSLSAHLTVGTGADPQPILRQANEALASGFGIRHSTLQIEETDEAGCPTGTCEGPH
jgi:cobalt-zinc-cadmium efflux system protein